mmetsp:Transcript_97200/g.151913  ORF Transcript_97200/g.151913 Transcript_97200/m.151913 type:complete len:92 (+) Transcript_97200:72-347(+)
MTFIAKFNMIRPSKQRDLVPAIAWQLECREQQIQAHHENCSQVALHKHPAKSKHSPHIPGVVSVSLPKRCSTIDESEEKYNRIRVQQPPSS